MDIEKDIQSLSNYESFARFMRLVHSLREETIMEMHEAPTERLQQISGRLITYDQILKMTNSEKLFQRHSESLKNM